MSVTDEAAVLAEARALRDEAWALVHGDVATLREGLSARPIAQRIRERATDEVVEVIEQARDVADDNKAIVAVVLAMLAGWFFRGPLGLLVKGVVGAGNQGESP